MTVNRLKGSAPAAEGKGKRNTTKAIKRGARGVGLNETEIHWRKAKAESKEPSLSK